MGPNQINCPSACFTPRYTTTINIHSLLLRRLPRFRSLRHLDLGGHDELGSVTSLLLAPSDGGVDDSRDPSIVLPLTPLLYG